MEALANKVLHEKKFNFQIKDRQFEVVQSVLDKLDTFVVLPTGYGKSVCYVLPPLMLNVTKPNTQHTSLVISPLKSIMQEQVKSLQAHDIRAFGIFDGAEKSDIAAIKAGQATILFASPESIVTKHWKNTIQEVYRETLCMVAYDEAHCISEWGLDFREDYRKVGVLHSIFECPVLALTATCTSAILKDISTILGLRNLNTISYLPNRPNTTLCICSCAENYEIELQWLIDMIRIYGKDSRKLIIYVNSVSGCERLYIWLHTILKDHAYCSDKSINNRLVKMFHSKTDEASKQRILCDLNDLNGSIRILIATVAVGMGIDIPDISLVILWGLPPSLFQLWQECGRCGRDGRQSLAVCYAYPRSIAFPCDTCRKSGLKACSCEQRAQLKELLSTDKCQRIDCMRQFAISSQSQDELALLDNKHNCGKQCTATCNCEMCRCCINCIFRCECPKRCTSIIEVIQQYINDK